MKKHPFKKIEAKLRSLMKKCRKETLSSKEILHLEQEFSRLFELYSKKFIDKYNKKYSSLEKSIVEDIFGDAVVKIWTSISDELIGKQPKGYMIFVPSTDGTKYEIGLFSRMSGIINNELKKANDNSELFKSLDSSIESDEKLYQGIAQDILLEQNSCVSELKDQQDIVDSLKKLKPSWHAILSLRVVESHMNSLRNNEDQLIALISNCIKLFRKEHTSTIKSRTRKWLKKQPKSRNLYFQQSDLAELLSISTKNVQYHTKNLKGYIARRMQDCDFPEIANLQKAIGYT